MHPESLTSPPALKKYDARSIIAAGLCLIALFADAMGWLLAIVGVFLLRRSVFPRKVKWILAAVALAPKILFLGVRLLSAPQGISFPMEPRTLATSSSLWAWSIALAAFGVYLLCLPRSAPAAPNAPALPAGLRTGLKVAGLVPIALAAAMLLGLRDDFQRIDDAGNGRWALKHAVRGAVATFTRDELASIEAVENRSSRSGSGYFVHVKLTDGRTFSAATTSAAAFQELRKFATTADLQPGKARIRPAYGSGWTNGTSGITLKDCIGSYEYVDERLGERSTFEFWVQSGRLGGRETALDGGRRYVHSLRNIVISDTGEAEFQKNTYAEVSEPSKSTISLSLRWSPQGESGRFTKEGLEIGLKKYRKQ
jgi:hypothetical protein